VSKALFATRAVNCTAVPIPLVRPLEGRYDARPKRRLQACGSRSHASERVEVWRFGGVVLGYDGERWGMGYRAYKSTTAKAWPLATS